MPASLRKPEWWPKLQDEGIRKQDICREKFLEHAWDWTHKHGGIILEQLKKLGASCDWRRTEFTMDEDMSASVIGVFIDLYNKGLIYRGVAWSTGIRRQKQPFQMRK